MTMNERQRRQRDRFQRQQEHAPRWFSFRVAAMAVAGEVLFQVALIFPLALAMVIGALIMNRVVIWWATLLAIPFFWWLLQPTLRLPGRPLSREAAPSLYALVDGLARSERSPLIDSIRIDGSFNAGALEMGRGWLPLRVRRILILGGPLLATLSADSVRAVIAHELGHFSREHGRLGHWVYRARQGWQMAATAGKNDSFLDQAAAAFAGWFAERFEVRAFVHARRCEYEADASAARAVGAAGLASSLAETHWCGEQWFRGEGERALERLQRMHSQPPADLWLQVAQSIRQAEGAASWLEHAWEEEASWADTHPALRERVLALGTSRDAVGHHLAQLAHAHAQLPGLDKVLADSLPPADLFHWRLTHARLNASADTKGQRLDSEPGRRFEQARRLADTGRAADALALLKELIATDPSWIAPARRAIAQLPRNVLGEDEAARNAALLERAWIRRAEAASTAGDEVLAGRAALAPPSAKAMSALAACLAAQDAVPAARLALTTAKLDERSRFEVAVLALRLDPVRLQAEGINEDEAAHILQDQLEQVLPPNVVVTVHRSYTTESTPRWQERLAAII
jgi:Zn-dependent protease with chaperone function